MYKLISTAAAAALVLVACGTEEELTFEMVDTTSEYTQCFEHNDTTFCIEGFVECFPSDDRTVDCYIRDEVAPAELAAKDHNLDRPTARLANEAADFDIDYVDDLEIAEPVVDPNFVQRACEMCEACDFQCNACGFCIKAKEYAAVMADEEARDNGDEMDEDSPHAQLRNR